MDNINEEDNLPSYEKIIELYGKQIESMKEYVVDSYKENKKVKTTFETLLNEYKSSLKILLNKIYNTSVNESYKQAASNFLLNNSNYEKAVVNKTQILSIINNLSIQLLDSKNKIANYEFNLAKNNFQKILRKHLSVDVNLFISIFCSFFWKP